MTELFTVVVSLIVLAGVLFYFKKKGSEDAAFSNDKVVLFSHSDLDGKTPGLLMEKAFGQNLLEKHYCSYGNINDRILEFIEERNNLEVSIFITDIGVNEEVQNKLQELYEKGQKIYLFDHHETNMGLNSFDWANVVMETERGKESGTSLLYDYLVSKNLIDSKNTFIKDFVETVRLYDTWEWYDREFMLAKQLNQLFFLVDFDMLHDFFMKGASKGGSFTSLSNNLLSLLEVENRRIEFFLKRKLKTLRFKEMFDRNVAIVYADQYHADLADKISDEHPEADVVAIIDIASKKGSLRSRKENIIVNDIAKHFGGGGHPKAAGFMLSEDAFKDFVVFE